MSYTPRNYEDIVRDVLTTLTGGTVRESLTAPADAEELLVPTKLKERPVRRISHLEGTILTASGAELPYRFTAADFELVSAEGDDDNPDSIQFREEGRRPMPGSTLVVNYYPIRTDPTPVTDISVGSVVRTVLETIAREHATAYLNLEHIYKSAFLESAEGPSLDKVVALVGVQRMQAGHPVAKLRVERRAGVSGRITIPANTAVTDDKGARYLTKTTTTLESYESTRDVSVRGESAATAIVEAGTLTRLETLIAGVSAVSNPEASHNLNAPESDADLRARTKTALKGNVRGTRDALTYGLLAVDGVKDVAIVESPNDVPGEISISVATTGNADDVLPFVRQRVEELRPVGIRVLPIGETDKRIVTVTITELTLAGTGVTDSELETLKTGVLDRLRACFDSIAAGGKVRRSQMLAAVMQDSAIADVSISLLAHGESPAEELQLNDGQTLEIESINFGEIKPEDEPETAVTSTVGAFVPLLLAAGTTSSEAESALKTAFDAHLSTRGPQSQLTVDGLMTALRDDTRYTIIRGEVSVTVETHDARFVQLTDGQGAYTPITDETLAAGEFNIDIREGEA